MSSNFPAMPVCEELSSQFEILNAVVDDKVLVRCGEICLSYSIDPEDFVDQWLAYSASKAISLVPTLDALDRLERYELKKQHAAAPSVVSTPQSVPMDVRTTPVRTPVRQNLQKEFNAVSPVSQSVPSQFQNRSDSGDTVVRFGEDSGFKDRATRTLSVRILNIEMEKSQYMFERFQARRASLDTLTRLVIADIIDHHNLELSQEKFKQFSGEVVVCGRIVSEGTGKLDATSILLEGPIDFYKGQRVKLSLNNVKKVRLFPGQGVVVKGSNYKDWFTANEIFTGTPIKRGKVPDLEETVRIVAAAGPFTLQENLLYEPLEHLLKQVNEFKPNILLLMGPFLENSHPHLENFNEFYETFFESIVQGIMQQLQDSKIQVVLVPSHKDLHSHVVFPTLPYKLKKRYDNLHLAPNPFVLDVDGVQIGGSTADIIFHLEKTEFCKGPYGDRIGQLVTHVFHQRNFYPLHPPDSDIRVDYQLLEQFGMLEAAPHVMILPSNFRNFVKVVDECVVVNPERLTKGNSGGSFAKIEVRPGPKDSKISSRVSCSIQRV